MVERDFTDDTLMDFESGHGEAPPDFVYSSVNTVVGNVNSNLDWIKQKGFEFGFISGEAICIGPKLVVLLPGDLTNLTARTLGRGLLASNKGGSPEAVSVAHEAGEPFTFGFQTHSGRMGILQLTGFTNNPRGVKIRYKLVQSGKAMESSAVESTDVREARAKLAALRANYGENHPLIQEALAKIKALETK